MAQVSRLVWRSTDVPEELHTLLATLEEEYPVSGFGRGLKHTRIRVVLLALLSLGIKNIHLGPTLPAFLSLNVTKVLIENFGIAGITTVEEDMNLFFGN